MARLNWNRTENTRRSGLDYSAAFDRAEQRIVDADSSTRSERPLSYKELEARRLGTSDKNYRKLRKVALANVRSSTQTSDGTKRQLAKSEESAVGPEIARLLKEQRAERQTQARRRRAEAERSFVNAAKRLAPTNEARRKRSLAIARARRRRGSNVSH